MGSEARHGAGEPLRLGGEGKPWAARRIMVLEHRQGKERRWEKETMGGGTNHGAEELSRQEVTAVKRNHGRRGKSWHHRGEKQWW